MKGKKAAPTVSAPKPTASSSKAVSDDSLLNIEAFWNHYSSETDTHTKIIDLFIVYLVAIIGCQFFYRLVVGDDFPRNAFVSGMFCPLGVIVLLVILRGRGRDLRQVAEFFLASLVLFITAINFAG
jgi:hypothetical protein